MEGANGGGPEALTFYESGPDGTTTLVKETAKASGAVRLPTPTASGEYTVRAFVSDNGIPFESLTLARYRASVPPLHAPAHLKASVRKHTAIVTWASQKRVWEYEVEVKRAHGLNYFSELPTRTRAITISLASGGHVAVRVVAVGLNGESSRGATLRVRAPR